MILINKATDKDYKTIADIGNVSVAEAHRNSCSTEELNEYMNLHYNDEAIKEELRDPDNLYHILYYNETSAAFSKIKLNTEHSNIEEKNVTKLDRIYLLKEFFNLKLGAELLKFNIELAKQNDQSGIWLFTWVGNTRAVEFYLKAGFEIIGNHNFKVTEARYNLNHHMFLRF